MEALVGVVLDLANPLEIVSSCIAPITVEVCNLSVQLVLFVTVKGQRNEAMHGPQSELPGLAQRHVEIAVGILARLENSTPNNSLAFRRLFYASKRADTTKIRNFVAAIILWQWHPNLFIFRVFGHMSHHIFAYQSPSSGLRKTVCGGNLLNDETRLPTGLASV
jgi:hypothetical protein